jgi:nuclear-control-of-ATPase protein 2
LTSVAVSRFRQLTTSTIHSPPSLFHLETWRLALPPSLFLTSLFPHLTGTSGLPSLSELNESESGGSTLIPSPTSVSFASASRLGRRTARSLVFLTLSPLALTRQEIAHQRKGIKKARDELATKIGELTLAASASSGAEGTDASASRGSHLGSRKSMKSSHSPPSLARLFSASAAPLKSDSDLSIEDVRQATWSTLIQLDSVLSSSAGPSITASTPPRSPSDLAHSLSFLLSRTLPRHITAFTSTSSSLLPPSALTRAWPYLLSLPLISYTAGRLVYANRDSLVKFAKESAETARRFVIDWVVEPVKKILETVRGGETVGLMGRESLKSDLDVRFFPLSFLLTPFVSLAVADVLSSPLYPEQSLERMVIDFARDEYRLSPDELGELALKVRSGDLTPVLRAWEKDIKVRYRFDLPFLLSSSFRSVERRPLPRRNEHSLPLVFIVSHPLRRRWFSHPHPPHPSPKSQGRRRPRNGRH